MRHYFYYTVSFIINAFEKSVDFHFNLGLIRMWLIIRLSFNIDDEMVGI